MRLLIRLLALTWLPVMLVACASTERINKVAASPSSATIRTDVSPSSAVSTNTSLPCSVTIPNGSTPVGERPSSYHHGNGALWTVLWPEGEVVFKPGGPGFVLEDGSLSMKWPWWRGVRGQLTIEGRRLDGAAPPLRAMIPCCYGDTSFQATALIFPTPGCWEVTGRVGQGSLTFVTQVAKIGEGPAGANLPDTPTNQLRLPAKSSGQREAQLH